MIDIKRHLANYFVNLTQRDIMVKFRTVSDQAGQSNTPGQADPVVNPVQSVDNVQSDSAQSVGDNIQSVGNSAQPGKIAQTATRSKIEARLINFDTADFSSLTLLDSLPASGKFGINHLEFEDERLNYELVLRALFSVEYNSENVGQFNLDSGILYACSLVRTSKNEDASVAIVFGDFYDLDDQGLSTANIAELELDPHGKITFNNTPHDEKYQPHGLKLELVSVKSDTMIDDVVTEIETPYIQVSRLVEIENSTAEITSISRYNVEYLVPIRFSRDVKVPTIRELKEIWINGDLDSLLYLLATPYKGGGGWTTLQSLAYSYHAAKLSLNGLAFRITHWDPPAPGKFKEEMIVHTDVLMPSILSKPKDDGSQFIARNVSSIKIAANGSKNCPVALLKAYSKLKPQQIEHLIEQGLFLTIQSANPKDPLWVPYYRVGFNKAALAPNRLTTLLDFEAILSEGGEMKNAALPESTNTLAVSAKAIKGTLDQSEYSGAF